MTPAYWLGNLAAWSAQAAALIAASGLAAWFARLRSPRVRLAYWQILLLVCLLLPVAEPWQRATGAKVDVTMTATRPASHQDAPQYPLPWRSALLAALAAGFAVRAVWLATGFAKLRGWRRTAVPFDPLPAHLDRLRAEIAPGAEFRMSAAVSGPVTFGLRRPLIVLPEHFAALPEDTQEAVACHELLHVRRGDWIVTIAEETIRALLWFHPAVWWLVSQMQLAREQAVDQEVVRLTRKRSEYLQALLALAGDQPVLDLAPATLFLRKRHLKYRVALLLKEGSMSKRNLISFCAASCGLLLAAGWFSLHTFPLQAAPAPQDSSGPALLHSVAPQYPQAAKDKHIEGSVVLELQIDEKGHVTDAHVLSGPEELRSAALQAVLQWHYSPEAMSLPATTQVTLDFKLPQESGPASPQVTPSVLRPFTLKSIVINSLTPSARGELLDRLPVHVGDTVDSSVFASVVKAARAFDDDLRVVAGADGALYIMLAGASSSPKIRVGGNVQQAKLVSKVTPVYPAEAKDQRIQGVVRLEATIGKDGKVENLVVLSGDPALAPAALEAVRQWQYQTTLLNGDPVEVVTEVNVNFTLLQ